MSQSNKADPKTNLPDKKYWAALLSKKDVESLAGYMDTLIEMDFEIKRRNKQPNDVDNSSN